MSTSSGVPNKGNRELFTTGQPERLDHEVIPGYDFPTDPPIATARIESVNQMLDDAESKAVDILKKQNEYVDSNIDDALRTSQLINATSAGYVGNTLDTVNIAANKIASKINKAAERQLGNAYSYALDLGMIYPTIEEVNYQLATKQFQGILPGDGVFKPTTKNPSVPEPPLPPAPPPPTVPNEPPPPQSPSEGEKPKAFCVYGANEEMQLTAFNNLWKIDRPFLDYNPGQYKEIGASGPLAMNAGVDNWGWEWEERKIGVPASGGGWFEVSVWVFPGSNLSYFGAFDKPAPANSIGWRYGCQPYGTCYFTNGEPLYPGCSLPPPTPPEPKPPEPPQPPSQPGEPEPPTPPTPTGECSLPIPANICNAIDMSRGRKEPTEEPCNIVHDLLSDNKDGKTLFSRAFAAHASLYRAPEDYGVFTKAASWINRQWEAGQAWIEQKVDGLANWAAAPTEGDAKNAAIVDATYYQTVYGFFSKWFGFAIPQWEEDIRRKFNVGEQYKIPSSSEADALFLTGKITKEQWTCFQQLDGQVVEWKWRGIEAKRSRLNAQELTSLYRRKLITDEQWKQGMRELGVVEREDSDRFYDYQTAQPGLQDVIRFMVRDVGDPMTVRQFQMDAEFDDKWQGELKEYGDALGVDPELAKYYWRAHWRLPSPTALNEMLHRLRPGRVAPEIEVTEADVEKVFAQDDLLPYWIKKQVAIGYNTMTRTDLTRAFQIRAIDEAELLEGFKDLGYNDRDSDILVKFYVKQRTVSRATKIGRTTPRAMINRYSKGIATRAELRNFFDRLGYTREEIDEVTDFADRERNYAQRNAIVSKVKREYQSGMIGKEGAITALIDHEIGLTEANEFVDLWIPKNQSGKPIKFKEAAAERLCKWRSMGIITATQQLTALMRQGWSGADAARIVGECEKDLADKESKELQKAADKAKKEAAAAEKKAKQDAKEREAEAKKAKKDAAAVGDDQ